MTILEEFRDTVQTQRQKCSKNLWDSGSRKKNDKNSGYNMMTDIWEIIAYNTASQIGQFLLN